jgi:hypothetical protein
VKLYRGEKWSLSANGGSTNWDKDPDPALVVWLIDHGIVEPLNDADYYHFIHFRYGQWKLNTNAGIDWEALEAETEAAIAAYYKQKGAAP